MLKFSSFLQSNNWYLTILMIHTSHNEVLFYISIMVKTYNKKTIKTIPLFNGERRKFNLQIRFTTFNYSQKVNTSSVDVLYT